MDAPGAGMPEPSPENPKLCYPEPKIGDWPEERCQLYATTHNKHVDSTGVTFGLKTLLPL